LLYAEESSEVWFADYGFGRLQNGRAIVPIDSLFAQTVSLQQPYHVFLQAYGDSALYVSNRTNTYFEVRGAADIEFSYRLVAKRLGFEGKRLDAASGLNSIGNNTVQSPSITNTQKPKIPPASSTGATSIPSHGREPMLPSPTRN
jgi:hypothetical protein